MPKPTYTISQVLAVPEGEWVNAEVFCNVSGVKPSRGKGPASATLSDSTGSITGKFWGGGIEHWEGKRIKIAGAGLQRKAYNGIPELSVSQKADISFAGAPGTAAQSDHHPDLEAAPAAQKPTQNRPAAHANTQTPMRGLDYYTALYVACLGAARKTCSDASFADDPETVRQIATAFFIQGLKDNIPVETNVPF